MTHDFAQELTVTWNTLYPDTPLNPRQLTLWMMQHSPAVIQQAFFQLAKKLTKLESIGETMSATDRQGYAGSCMARATGASHRSQQ